MGLNPYQFWPQSISSKHASCSRRDATRHNAAHILPRVTPRDNYGRCFVPSEPEPDDDRSRLIRDEPYEF